METILGLIGLIALVIGGCCLFFLLFVQPIWGLVDVATSKHHSRGVKAAVILLTLLLLGPFATFFYACIGTRTRALRVTTLASLGVFLLAGGLTFAMAMVIPAVQEMLGRWQTPAPNFDNEVETTAATGAVRGAVAIEADVVDPETVPSFTAVQLARSGGSQWRASIAEFTGRGPRAQSALPVALPSIHPLTHVTVNTNGPIYYGITTHDVGLIAPNSGHFVELKPNPGTPKPSWPTAIAFDTRRELLLVTARSQGHSYNPKTGEWKTLPWLKDDGIIALAYDAGQDLLYGLQTDTAGKAAVTLQQFNTQGALLGTIRLSNPIPVGRYPYAFAQLAFADGQLVCLVSPSEKELDAGNATGSRSYLIEIPSGHCRAVRPATLTSKE